MTDEQGEEIYSAEYSGAKLLENPMLVRVSSGEIVSVSTDRGEVTGCELDGGTASFVWSGSAGQERHNGRSAAAGGAAGAGGYGDTP